ncbi:MAG: glycosyltransferase family 4 protein [Gammaproteobacteria bacterium]|nr:glycosyltransferase family 4 protein [Gammaproteobacteria bacterium]
MRTILHTIDTTGPGGAETVFIDLATRLPKEKYRSIVVIRGKGWVYEELCRRGVTPILLDSKGSFNLRYLWQLRKIIQREGVDLIQSHLLGTGVYCSLLGLITGKSVISTFHGSVDISENERFKGLKFAAINAGASRIVAVTDSLLNDIVSRTSLCEKKACVIYNGIDTSVFLRSCSRTLRKKYGWSEKEIIIGSLGNIRPAKGYDILLKAAALLERSDYSYRFVIAGQGKGALYDKLLALRKELALEETVQFLGFLDDAADFLASIDIFLSSSISEGLPLSAIQAMVAELPIVATRCGGYVGLISEGENGLLVDVGNPCAIAETIKMLAADSELQTKLAKNAKRFAVKTYGLEVMLNAYEQLYDEFSS